MGASNKKVYNLTKSRRFLNKLFNSVEENSPLFNFSEG